MTFSLRGLRASGGLPAFVILTAALAAPASAHHLMESRSTPEGIWDGLLSGLAHPLLGLDHLLFLLAIGVVGLSRPLIWIPLLLACGLGGSVLGVLLPGLPGAEALVAASLLVVALVLLVDWSSRLLLPTMALHGYVLSGTVLGWESTPLAFYLLGLLISQGCLLLVGVVLVRHWGHRLTPQLHRVLSWGLIGVGAALLWSSLAA